MSWIWKSLIISTFVGFGIFIFIFYSETGQFPDLKMYSLTLIVSLAFFNLVGVGLHYLSLYYNNFLPWKKNITARFFLEVSSGLILLALVSLLYTGLFLNNIELPDSETTFWQEYWDGAVKFGIVSLVVIYIYSLVTDQVVL